MNSSSFFILCRKIAAENVFYSKIKKIKAPYFSFSVKTSFFHFLSLLSCTEKENSLITFFSESRTNVPLARRFWMVGYSFANDRGQILLAAI